MRDIKVPQEIKLFYHEGCSRGHFAISEVRKCKGSYVHLDEVREAIFRFYDLGGILK